MKVYRSFLPICFSVFFLLTWSAAQTHPTGTVVNESDESPKQIIGAVEYVRVIPGDLVFESRIDTGATTCSIGVESYEVVNEDGKEWVEFVLNGKKFKEKLVKYTYIKKHGRKATKRAVIRMRLILGDISESVNVNLANRKKFKYQLLIGRNFLYDRFIVDVSMKHTAEPMPYKE